VNKKYAKHNDIDIGNDIGFAVVTACKRWHLVAKIVSILENEPLHLFGNCAKREDFNGCFAIRQKHTNVWCHEYIYDETNLNKRLVKHYSAMFEFMFRFYKYNVFVEDDLKVSDRLPEYFRFTQKVMEIDESVFCASAWSDNAIYSPGPFRVLRQEHFGGLGWMTSLQMYNAHIKPMFVKAPQLRTTWDGIMSELVVNENHKRSGAGCRFECLRPTVALTHHMRSDTRVSLSESSGLYSQNTFDQMPHATGNQVNLSIAPENLSCNRYQDYMKTLLSNSKLVVECIKAVSNADKIWSDHMHVNHRMFGVGFKDVVRGVHDGAVLIYSHDSEVLVIAKYSSLHAGVCEGGNSHSSRV